MWPSIYVVNEGKKSIHIITSIFVMVSDEVSF